MTVGGDSVRLADMFFFVALDDRSGRLRLPPKVAGLGLAGGLLGELILDERITVAGDRVRVVSRLPLSDQLATTVLLQLTKEITDHPVRNWLAFFARRSTEEVAGRLRAAGHIEERRSRWRSKTPVYPPTDPNFAFAPTARLATKLRAGEPMTWVDAALCGLVAATGLDQHVLANSGAEARDYLRHILEHLTPALHALVWHLHAAVGDAVLTFRT
ncbi:MAG TPA: GPP34 family phosphoprotein [Natronosporangium sp.]